MDDSPDKADMKNDKCCGQANDEDSDSGMHWGTTAIEGNLDVSDEDIAGKRIIGHYTSDLNA